KGLMVPAAGTGGWIGPDPPGHVQAPGTDAAVGRHYLYRPVWRGRRDAGRFDRMIQFARRLPRLRAAAARHLEEPSMSRERVMAFGTRLLDRGVFRVVSEVYAEQKGTVGVATLHKGDVACNGNEVTL